jgi:hypothetical protein
MTRFQASIAFAESFRSSPRTTARLKWAGRSFGSISIAFLKFASAFPYSPSLRYMTPWSARTFAFLGSRSRTFA